MDSIFIRIALDVAALVWFYMSAWYFASLRLQRFDVVDVAWGMGFVTIAWWGLLSIVGVRDVRMLLTTALVSIWGIRLAAHIAVRDFAPDHPEDPRYAEWRAAWGRYANLRAYPQIFMLQGALMWLVASPIMAVIALGRGPLGPLDIAGGAVWAAGLTCEMVGDQQLAAHLAEPGNRGRPLTTGLWAWTRHPNYFGDALAWWGIGLFGVAAGGGWTALAGPLVMTLLLRFVSGVPLLERRHRGDPEWDEYRAHTSTFLPRWPRR